MKSDEQLIASYRDSRQREALEELTERHLGTVRAMIYPMVLDQALADDLTQEVFLRAFRGLAGFNGRAKFSTWLYRVAMNTAHSFLARRNRSPVTFYSDVPDCPESERHSPDGAAVENEVHAEVSAALADLTPKLRAAVVLMVLEQMDAARAAEIEGCTAATMYWRLHEDGREVQLGLAGGPAAAEPSMPPLAVRIVVLRRSLTVPEWKTVWTADVVTRDEEVVELTPEKSKSASLRMWAQRLPDGMIAVDSDLTVNGGAQVRSSFDGVQKAGVPEQVYYLRTPDDEYQVLQTMALVAN